ncbi:MAG: acetylxylan esterase, partial [Planctomycetaceae bacterium]|nr:acetylxylan esterase [Planctomycetaceae bacterium]
DQYSAAAVDTGGFRFDDLADWKDARFLPGAVKYGDLPTLLALSAPGRLWIGGETGAIPIVTNAYSSAGTADAVTVTSSRADAAIAWLLQQ